MKLNQLDDDIFKHNRQLQDVALSYNPINKLPSSIFSLEKLTELQLDKTGLPNDLSGYYANRTQVLELLDKIK